MAQRYVVKKGDTLAKLAKRFYGNSKLFRRLALFNRLQDAGLIRVGQALVIPPRAELEEEVEPALERPAGVGPSLAPPRSLEELKRMFGDVAPYVRSDGSVDPRWEQEILGHAPLPIAIPLDWSPSQVATRVRCHKKLVGVVTAVFQEIQKRGYWSKIKTYGGCYEFRRKRTSDALSTHCWGIAIDLNPGTNRQGTKGDMAPEVVEVFEEFQFTWGGRWRGRGIDPMHFQFCSR